MILTKLQNEFIDKDLPKRAYVVFPLSIFTSKEYKQWKRDRLKKIVNK